MTGHFGGCTDIRHLLGVYVVGAIEPAERAIVDTHLAHCTDCREELASLAPLPALLGRVPAADVERLVLGDHVPDEPPAELLDSLLRRVSARRRARRFRLVTAAAAAAVIALGGGLAGGSLISHLNGSTGPASARDAELARGTNAATHVAAAVYYNSASSGTRMEVQVSGLPAGMHCVFWVITREGHHVAVGRWISGSDTRWYSASTSYTADQLTGFDVSLNGHVLVKVPIS
jgi:putative zinc finger protein